MAGPVGVVSFWLTIGVIVNSAPGRYVEVLMIFFLTRIDPYSISSLTIAVLTTLSSPSAMVYGPKTAGLGSLYPGGAIVSVTV